MREEVENKEIYAPRVGLLTPGVGFARGSCLDLDGQ